MEKDQTMEVASDVVSDEVLSSKEDTFWNVKNWRVLKHEEEKEERVRLEKDKEKREYLGRYIFERVEELLLRVFGNTTPQPWIIKEGTACANWVMIIVQYLEEELEEMTKDQCTLKRMYSKLRAKYNALVKEHKKVTQGREDRNKVTESSSKKIEEKMNEILQSVKNLEEEQEGIKRKKLESNNRMKEEVPWSRVIGRKKRRRPPQIEASNAQKRTEEKERSTEKEGTGTEVDKRSKALQLWMLKRRIPRARVSLLNCRGALLVITRI